MKNRNPKYDWLKNGGWSLEQLKDLRANATKSGTKQVITKLIRARTNPDYYKSPDSEWSRKHNWALFRAGGAAGISNLAYELSQLSTKNPIGQQFKEEYKEIISHIDKAYTELRKAEDKLRLINVKKLAKHSDEYNSRSGRGRKRYPPEQDILDNGK